MKEHVILVHGLWMRGYEMTVLRKHLQQAGYEVSQFRYQSLLHSPRQSAEALHQLVESLEAQMVHFVAHSLGGIVLTHLMSEFPVQRPGHVVMIGTPLNPSATAQAYYNSWIFRPLLGRSVERGLLGGRPRWPTGRTLGVVAGDRGMGVGRLLFSQLASPNDGTVSVDETLTQEVTKHLQVPFSHFGVLFAKPVAEAVVAYLRTGRFL